MPARAQIIRTPSRGQEGRASGDHQTDGTQSGNVSNDNVRVVVRVRPMNDQEIENNSTSIIHVLDENVLIFDPKQDNSPSNFFHGRKVRHRNMLKRKNRDIRFAFDRVFDGSAAQECVYENTTKTIVDSVLNGFNASGRV